LTLRLFVAADLDEPVRTALVAWRAGTVDDAVWRAVPDASLHITLAFLGSCAEASVDGLAAALPADRRAPALALGAPLLLPARRPRVLVVVVEDTGGGLAALHAAVLAALGRAGEVRRFRPHVTVARLGRAASAAVRSGPAPGRPASPPRSALPVAPPALRFAPPSITLYRSQPGSVYTALATRALR